MYATIHVPVDNSDFSNASVRLCIALGSALGARVVGSHVYAARLHDMRFKQMEFTLPDEYKEENELEKQRKIHDALIARGLHLISDSYLDVMGELADEGGLDFERKHFDGRNFEAVVEDVDASDYDLVILGALGQGAVRNSEVGSVCERMLRRTDVDTLVIRDPDRFDLRGEGALVVALDGSERAWGALCSATHLAGVTGRPVQVVSVLAPRWRAEEALVEAHLRAARRHARQHDVRATTTLVEGDPLAELLALAERTGAWCIAAGRTGLDTADGEVAVGSLTEGLVRQSPCHVLVGGRPRPAATEAVRAVAG